MFVNQRDEWGYQLEQSLAALRVSVETLDSTLKIGCFEWMLQVFNPSDRYLQLTSYGHGWKDIFGSVHICPHPVQEIP
jgi:hypothetical protein